MGPHTSPALARRQLRLALRRAREAAGLTQGQVAEELEWSISKVNRIETGDVKVSSSDLAALLRLLNVTDPAVVADFAEQGRASRRRGWWNEPPVGRHLPPTYRQLIEFEAGATVVRCFHPALVPGILQTEAYAQEILDTWQQELEPDVREARVQTRLRRRATILDRPDPPYYLLILDESVVWREVGGPKVMAEQLELVLQLARSARLQVRILPFREGTPWTAVGGFFLCDVEEEENVLLYQESAFGDQVVQASDQVRYYRARFDRMWELSLDEDASARLMRARAAAMLASLDRGSRG
jgi:transcriptional regulator with XRE-family HTH domain